MPARRRDARDRRRRGEQLPFASEGRLRGTRRLAANQPATFRFALPEPVRAFATASIAAGEVALATTSVTVTPPGGASYPAVSQTAIHLRTTPNRSTAGLDAIALPPDVKPPASTRVRRYAISVCATGRATPAWTGRARTPSAATTGPPDRRLHARERGRATST